MKKTMSKFFSFLLALSMVCGMMVVPTYAAPVKAEPLVIVEDDVEVVEEVETTEEAEVVKEEKTVTSGKVSSVTEVGKVEFSMEKFNEKITVDTDNIHSVKTEVEVDKDDPAIKAVMLELKDMRVMNAAGEPVPLTAEQQAQVLGMYQQYLDHWKANANILGVQTPFFLQYNDNGEDGLGVLGEMLALAGVSVDVVRAGYMTFDEVTGMIQNFMYGDALGVALYGEKIAAARDEALAEVEASGAKTEAQKLLVLNDWLAHHSTFNMPYIMNSGKADNEKPMVAEEPKKHEHYDTVYKQIYGDYEKSIRQQFEGQILAGLEAELTYQFYDAAIREGYYQGVLQGAMANGMSQADAESYAAAEADKFVADNAEAIAADPDGFARKNFGDDAADEMAMQCEYFIADVKENGLEVQPGYKMSLEDIVAQQMETPMDDLGGMTPNQAIPVFADQAAVGLTQGVLDYWDGSHIGALGAGPSVCLGYAKAFVYLVQYMHPEIYGVNGASTDMSKSENWKEAKDLYYDKNGKLDVDANYVADMVRISFDASVTMYGETQDNFNSDHFWNAVKVDGKWYYVDPCYTDVFTEVMQRDRVETDGSMNHLYFLFSHDSAEELYDGYYSEIKTLYDGEATFKDYEDAWVSRIASNSYSDGTNFYYIYDSTDLISTLSDFNNNTGNMDYESFEQEATYKLVGHTITNTDAGTDGDTNYTTYIEFNYKANEDDEDSVARVRNSSGQMVENETLTKAYAEHKAATEIYPSIAITTSLYNGKLYFNLANAIFSYDLSSGNVNLAKEYSSVSATRDKSGAFGGMAFSVVSSGGDFTVKNHPIAGFTIKEDGKAYVSIATNFAFISGKDPHNSADQGSFGYEYEESNFNSAYNTYSDDEFDEDMMQQYGYEKEKNDNDEFMWTANFVDIFNASSLGNSNASNYKGMACSGHHYIRFEETYYTKDDNGKWNTGFCYVCTNCGAAVEEPTEPNANADYSQSGTSYEELKAQYDKEKAAYDEIVKAAGHTLQAQNAKWSNDNETVSMSGVKCTYSACTERHHTLDCLLEEPVNLTFDSAKTFDATILSATGECETGATVTYEADCRFKHYGKNVQVVVTKENVKLAEGQHPYNVEAQWKDASNGGFSATANVVCVICGDSHMDVPGTVSKNSSASTAATCLQDGQDVYDASFNVTIGEGETATTQTVKATKTVDLEAKGSHTYTATATWTEETDGTYSAVADLKCSACGHTEKSVGGNVVKDTKNSVAATCTTDGKDVYVATFEVLTGEIGKATATKEVVIESAGTHNYSAKVRWSAVKDNAGNITGYNAVADLTCGTCGVTVKDVAGTVTKSETKPTCDTDGKVVYTATFEVKSGEVGTATATKTILVEMLGHKWDAGKETDDSIIYTCETCGITKEVLKAPATRVYGPNRYGTSFASAEALKEELKVDKFEAVVIASGDSFADALSGSYLAAVKNAPIILTNGKNVDDVVSYVSENLEDEGIVFILGGTFAVKANVETALKDAGCTVKRVAGTTRFDTNLEILKEAGVAGEEAILVATGSNFADSLSASGANKPILLVDKTLTDAQKAFLEDCDDTMFYILGGKYAVSEDMEKAIAKYGDVERVAGTTRYDTSVEIAKKFFENPKAAVFAYGMNYPDGLCGGSLAVAMDAPLILTETKVTTQAEKYVSTNGILRGVFLGGSLNISDSAIRTILDLEADVAIKEIKWDK